MSPLPLAAPLPFVPDAVIFDMDGLMLDSERAINACMAQAARDLGHDLPASLWLQCCRRSPFGQHPYQPRNSIPAVASPIA